MATTIKPSAGQEIPVGGPNVSQETAVRGPIKAAATSAATSAAFICTLFDISSPSLA